VFTADEVHPVNIALRAQYAFLFDKWSPQAGLPNLKEGELAPNYWKEVEKSRTWLSELPYPQLLHLNPEAFIVSLQES